MWFKPFLQSYLVVFIGYLTMYLIRKNFNVAQNDMISTYGLSMTELGLIGLGFSITYGIGKTVVSYYADGKNTKQFLPFMLILSGLAMLGFSFSMGGGSASLFMMIAFYALSGFFQSTGGPSSYSTITKWTPRNKRGSYLGLWNMSHNVGGAGAAGVALFGANYFFDGNVIGMFVFPSIIAIIVGFIGMRFGNDSPEAYGLGTVEELFDEEISGQWRNDPLELAQENHGQGLSYREILKTYVFSNKYIWLLAFSYVLVYIVRTAVNDWGNLYLTEEHNYTLINANAALSLFEIGGFIGSLVAGWGSDRLFAGNRGPMNILFAIGIFLSVSALWLMPLTNFVFQAAGLFCIGFFVFGPQMLIGMAAAECSHKDSAGAATGFVGLFAYMGAALSGYPLALILETYGWTGFFVTISTCAAVIGLLLLPFLQAQSPQKTIDTRYRL
ncbi:UNVERIFIED_CONTAM: hypothetical protein GTU68_064580 [Idotea baltica]|nr:hypothetical protein [Idotea baltica]